MSLRLERPPTTDPQYDRVAGAAAALVIRDYSSSFGLASRLLHPPVRHHVHNVYALVRLADEVVDSPRVLARAADAAGFLDRLETETVLALRGGYSTNLVVHAFALSARACGIDSLLVRPFFASMRTDLTVQRHDAASFERYVYGSAEVVGLMCLRIFLAGHDQQRYDRLAPGARRLGSAFQKVNFLRDLTTDFEDLGRWYFPGVDPRALTEDDKHRLLDDIDADLAAAAVAVRALPPESRSAVAVAHALFAQLSVQLRATPADVIMQRRVRLSSATKARVALGVLAREHRP